MLTTSNCCLCLSLRTGTLIIGSVSLMGSACIIGFVNVFGEAGLAVGLSQLLAALALMFGVYKVPYTRVLFWHAVFQSCMVLMQIIAVAVLLAAGADSSEGFGGLINAIITFILIWLVQAYAILVVYSYYKKIDSYA